MADAKDIGCIFSTCLTLKLTAMKEETKNKAIRQLNSYMLCKVTNIINQELGLNTSFEISADHYPWCGWTITLFENCEASQSAITCNPLLAQMFKTARLSVKVGRDEFLEGKWIFRVIINYTHNFDKGMNGVDVMNIYITELKDFNFDIQIDK